MYYNDNDIRTPSRPWPGCKRPTPTEPKYWNLNTEAKIRLKLKDYRGAMAAAEKSKKLALESLPPNGDYVKMDEELIAEAKKGGRK